MRTLFVTLCICVPLVLLGQDNEEKSNLFNFDVALGFGWTFGGDRVAEYKTTTFYQGISRGFNSKSILRANGAALISLGFNLKPPGKIPIGLQTTIGYHIDRTADVSDLNSTWKRNPIDVNPYVLIKRVIRVGGGITYHLNPRFHEDLDGLTFNFKNTTGRFVEVGVGGHQFAVLSLRFSQQTFEIEDIDGAPTVFAQDLNGNGWSIRLTFLIK